MGKTNCNSCKGEINWKEPMIIHKNKAYCEICYEELKESERQFTSDFEQYVY